MRLTEIAKIKADLLCYGVRLETRAKEISTIKNSYLLDGGFVHAAHFLIDGIVINTCISEDFCKRSPYEISIENDESVLRRDGEFISRIEVLPLPDWCLEKVDGYMIGDYLRPHSPNCISCCPVLKCTYYANGTQCKFCSLGARADSNEFTAVLPVTTVVKMIEEALQYNSEYEIALSGGTCSSDDKSALYFSEICEMLKDHHDIQYEISVEMAPPDRDEYIEKLFDAGATALIMNIEIANEMLRKTICPGKSNILLSRYFSAMKKAVSIFGRGKVSSVLIAGIQPSEDILTLCKKLIPMGVVPTIIPFKPLDGCQMSEHPIASADEVLRIAEEVNELLRAEKLVAGNQGGCTKCGGCSLESVFQLTYNS